jgi:hypothetical protein
MPEQGGGARNFLRVMGKMRPILDRRNMKAEFFDGINGMTKFTEFLRGIFDRTTAEGSKQD